MNHEQQQTVLYGLGISVVIGGLVCLLLYAVAGCTPEPTPKTDVKPPSIPVPIMPTSQVARVVAAEMRTEAMTVAPAFNLTTSNPPPPFVAAAPAITNRGSVTLEWNHSPDTNVVGYRLYFWSDSTPGHAQFADVGYKTRATITGLPEGVRITFRAVSYDKDGIESTFSNEATTVTPVYVGMFQDRWSVVTSGIYGKTNLLQSSTNLSDWVTQLEFVGDGTIKRLLHTNVQQAWFRVMVK